MTVDENFHARRARGIGGSDVAAIFGLDPYRTNLDLWLEKTGQVTPLDIGNRPDVRRGNRLEPLARQLFVEQFGGSVRKGTFRVHPKYPFILGHPDGVWTPPDATARTQVVEVKCPSLGMFGKLQREGLPFSWLLQMQHYLMVTGREQGQWAIYCADRDHLITFPVKADPALHETLVEHESEFWACVENMQPPAEPPRPDAPGEVEVVGTVTKRIDEAFCAAANDLREAAELRKSAEQVEKDAKAALIALAGAYGTFESPAARFYYREMPGRKSFDKAALGGAKPLDRLKVGALLTPYFHSGAVPEAIIKAIGEANLDLAQFDKPGKPFPEFRSYFFGGV